MPRKNASVIIDRRTLCLTALVVALLALPACLGLLRGKSNAEAVQHLEKRNPAPMPPLRLLRENARDFIALTDRYMKDAVHFRLPANALYRKARYTVFKDAPLPNLTIGRSGHVFLNGPLPNMPNRYFEALCMEQGDPAPELLRRLDETFAAASRYFTDRGARVTIAIVPTTPTLYADKLPFTVPAAYRRACLDYHKKDFALGRLERRGEATGQYRVFYPHALFAAHRNEPYFYPKERYHCEGKSVYLFTRHLLKESGAVAELLLDDPATLTGVKHDIAGFFGYALAVDAWGYPYAGQPTEERRETWFIKAFGGRPDLLNHNITPNSLTAKTALMIGNSFGTSLSPHLARGFRNLYFLDTNNFTEGQEQKAVFAAVAERIRPDFVYFVFDDMNVTNLPDWLAGFVELEQEKARRMEPSAGASLRERAGELPGGPF